MLEIKNLTKVYRPKSGVPTTALDNVNIKFEEKGMVFILGKSGSGKSTLLNLIGGLDSITSGEIIIKGKSSANFSQSDFDSYRNTFIGFIFQEYNILPEFTVGKNIGLALELQGKRADGESINNILHQVDMIGYEHRKPAELSGGQKQRIAIARALIKDPEIIMADEPTGALDSNTGRQVLETLKRLSQTKLVIVVSHDREYAEIFGDRIVEFADGKVIGDIKKYHAQGNVVSAGVNIVDNKIIQIKQGHKLSQPEKNAVIEFLESAPNGLIISKDDRSNKDFRKVARIDDNGNKECFSATTEKNISIKEYNENDFKLIRSRLPFKHSLKMGASSLKSKPVRLVFTILLSAIAFALFGLADTLGAYNKYTTTYTSMLESDINYASFVKKVGREESDYTYWQNTNMSDADYQKIKEKFPDYSFDKVYGDTSLDYSYNVFGHSNNNYGLYYIRNNRGGSLSFEGFIEMPENGFTSRGYTLIGNYPANNNEIVISQYIYNTFKDFGYCADPILEPTKKITITKEDDLINQTITVNKKVYTICGIVDTKFNEARYSEYKTPLTSASWVDMMVPMELSETMPYSYHAMMFVREGYKAANSSAFKKSVSSFYISGYQPNIVAKFDEVKSKVTFFDSTKTSLADDEIIVTLPALSQFFDWENFNNYENSFSYGLDGFIKSKIAVIYDDYIKDDYEAVLTASGISFGDIYLYLGSDNYCSYALQYYNNPYYNPAVPAPNFTIPGYTYEDLINKYYSEYLIKYVQDILMVKSLNTTLEDYSKSYQTSYIKIVGVYNEILDTSYRYDDYHANYGIILNSNLYITLLGDGDIQCVITSLKGNRASDMELIKFSYQENDLVRYSLNNAVAGLLDSVSSMIEIMSKAFLYIGIGFAAFAMLMMLNFIAVSISYKKREIGILRAIGAKSSDVFGIFFTESAIIALISFVLASILTLIGCLLVNILVRTEMNLLLTLFNYGIRQIALVFAVSIFTAFIASFLPVYRIATKKPIDSIKNG